MSRLALTLLGGFEVDASTGAPVVIPTRKAQALLAYMALSRGASRSRDQLAALLWPDLPSSGARNALRQTLFLLRKAIASGAASGLQVTDDIVLLPVNGIETDVAAFEKAVALGTPAALEQAAVLYRGDLLAGVTVSAAPFEDWLMSERERLRELAMEALARLLAHHQASEATRPAVLTALRLLALDPTQEAVHRTLMRLYVIEGRRDAALRQYAECVEILERELGAEPEPDTRALYQEVLRERPAPSATPAVPALSEGPMIGRHADVARVHEALNRAWSGWSGLVAIVGEAGIGKSRLLAELAAEGKRRGGRLLLGRAYENQRMTPLAPWVGALRDAGIPGDHKILDDLDTAWRGTLARLLPELGDPEPAPDSWPGDQLRLFEALAHLLRRLAIARPLLVLLEDCHWADDMTLRFLAFFARRLHAAPVFLAISARDEELADRALLETTLAELASEERLCRVDLGRLGREDTLALIEQLARPSSRANLEVRREQVWVASAGNPFIVVETMRSIGEGLAGEAPAGLPLPAQVRDTIAHRLGRLSARGRTLVAVASVIGREFDFGLLPVAAGLDAATVAEALDELVRRRVLHGVADRLDFTHDRIRDVAYGELSPGRRRALHTAVAAAMEAVYAEDLERHYATLAIHYDAGGVWSRAVQYFRHAGIRSMEQGAYHESAAAFDRALAALAHLDDDAPTASAALDLRLRLRNALLPIGDHARMLDNLRRAELLAERLDDRSRLGWILSYSALERWRTGEAERAIELAERVLTLAAELDDRGLRIIAGIRLGQAYHSVGRYADAIDALRVTVSALTDDRTRQDYGLSAPPSVIARVWLGWCLAERGDFGEARQHADDALAIAEELKQPYPLAAACFGLGLVEVRAGDLDHAIGVLDRGITLCRNGQIPVFLSWTASLLAMASAAAGQTERYASLLDPGADLGIQRNAAGHAFPLVWLAEACRLAGRLDQAATLGREAVDRAVARRDRGHEAYAVHLLAEVAARRGGREAETLFRRARALADELGMAPLCARADAALARLPERLAPGDTP